MDKRVEAALSVDLSATARVNKAMQRSVLAKVLLQSLDGPEDCPLYIPLFEFLIQQTNEMREAQELGRIATDFLATLGDPE